VDDFTPGLKDRVCDKNETSMCEALEANTDFQDIYGTNATHSHDPPSLGIAYSWGPGFCADVKPDECEMQKDWNGVALSKGRFLHKGCEVIGKPVDLYQDEHDQSYWHDLTPWLSFSIACSSDFGQAQINSTIGNQIHLFAEWGSKFLNLCPLELPAYAPRWTSLEWSLSGRQYACVEMPPPPNGTVNTVLYPEATKSTPWRVVLMSVGRPPCLEDAEATESHSTETFSSSAMRAEFRKGAMAFALMCVGYLLLLLNPAA